MKTAIFTLTVGNPTGYIPCMLCVRDYARRLYINYFVSTRLDIRFYTVCFEKFRDFKFFDTDFDRVLFLDRDVLPVYWKSVRGFYSDNTESVLM